MNLHDQMNVAKLLNTASSIYKNVFVGEKKHQDQFKSGYCALLIFLEGYAYQRQGAAEAYSQIALKCISDKCPNGKHWDIPTKEDAKNLWNAYKEMARDHNLVNEKTGEPKVNKHRNPMNQNKGVIDQLASIKKDNIAVYIKELIRGGNTVQAYHFMKNIRGIGEKISSFYLRDIVYLAEGLDEDRIENSHLLQPIDTWLEQTLTILFGPNVPKKLTDKQKQIVELCKRAGVSSISFNQGAWVLGSQVAGEYETLKKLLKDSEFAQEHIEEHITRKEKYLKEVNKVLKRLRQTG